MSLQVELVTGAKIGLSLRNPIMVASGFAGFGPELAKIGDISQLGALVTHPISPHPWPGAEQPRLHPMSGGFLLNTGNQNPGLRGILRDYAPGWANLGVPVIARACGATPHDHARVASRLEQVQGVMGLELDPFGGDAQQEGWGPGLDTIRAAREATQLPLLVAMPLGAPTELAGWCVEEGADALVLCSPPEGMAWDPERGCLARGRVHGLGLMPLVLASITRLAASLDVPLVGRGGIHTFHDVLAYLKAGARAVQVGSVVARQPSAPWDILEGLEGWMAAQGMGDLDAFACAPGPDEAT